MSKRKPWWWFFEVTGRRISTARCHLYFLYSNSLHCIEISLKSRTLDLFGTSGHHSQWVHVFELCALLWDIHYMRNRRTSWLNGRNASPSAGTQKNTHPHCKNRHSVLKSYCMMCLTFKGNIDSCRFIWAHILCF